MTHRDGLPGFSARSVRRSDAGHRKPRATLSESLGKPPFRIKCRQCCIPRERDGDLSSLWNGWLASRGALVQLTWSLVVSRAPNTW